MGEKALGAVRGVDLAVAVSVAAVAASVVVVHLEVGSHGITVDPPKAERMKN